MFSNGAGRVISAAAVLPLCGTYCFNLSTAVGPVLNATVACQDITSKFFEHCNPYPVSKLLPEFRPQSIHQ